MRKTVILSNKTIETVKTEAKKDGVSQSQYIEIAINYYLNSLKPGVVSNGK